MSPVVPTVIGLQIAAVERRSRRHPLSCPTLFITSIPVARLLRRGTTRARVATDSTSDPPAALTDRRSLAADRRRFGHLGALAGHEQVATWRVHWPPQIVGRRFECPSRRRRARRATTRRGRRPALPVGRHRGAAVAGSASTCAGSSGVNRCRSARRILGHAAPSDGILAERLDRAEPASRTRRWRRC